MKTMLLGKVVSIDGDTWKILGVGVRKDDKVFCHLASMTRGRQQRNGWYPLQQCDFVDENVLGLGTQFKESGNVEDH